MNEVKQKPSTKTKQGRRRMQHSFSPTILLSHIFVGASCFYGGLMLGSHSPTSSNSAWKQIERNFQDRNPEEWDEMMTKIKKQAAKIKLLTEQLLNVAAEGKPVVGGTTSERSMDTEPRFFNEMSSIAGGMAAVDRMEFAKKFDVGVPLQENSKTNEQVLLLYSHKNAVPTSDPFKAAEAKSNTRIPFIEDIDVATENCDILNIILTQPDEKQQCVAFLGQYRSYHMQKFMRLPEEGKVDRNIPLRLVNRGAQASGRLSQRVPKASQTLEYWKSLTNYLQNWDTALGELKPVAESAAIDNTIVVMVCNYGASIGLYCAPVV